MLHQRRQQQKLQQEKLMALKHVGRIKSNKARLVIAYRTLPGDPYSALVIPTSQLPADEHDTLMKSVESHAGQNANEFYEVMQRTVLPDGRNMLAGFHQRGNMRKVSTADIEMTPDTRTVIGLKELNEIIAQQKGVALEDLSMGGEFKTNKPTANETPVTNPAEAYVVPTATPVANDGVLDDATLAASFRSQADRLSKEAAALRRQAEELFPTKKATSKKTEGVETK
jgi:hypothetical protein